MSELGSRFKTERERRGISIQEIGLSLKISSRVITAIENGDRELLPARTFLRGFVKSYAQFLRMDIKETMDLFQKEYGDGTPAAPKDPSLPADGSARSDSEVVSTPGSGATTVASTGRGYSEGPSLAKENIQEETKFPIGKILIGLILFVAVIVLAKLVDKYQKERILPTTEAEMAESLEGAQTITDSAGDDSALLTLGTLETANPVATSGVMSTSTPEPTPASSSSAVASPTPTPTPTATPAPTSTPSTTPTPKPSPSPTATPTATPSPTPRPKPSPVAVGSEDLGRILEVMVETNKAVRIRYDLGNGKLTTLDLAEGELHTFRSRSPIALDISDGGALNLIVNGRDRGKPGTSGSPVQLRLRE